MSKVTIYTTMLCPYCHRAKALLRRKGVEFEEIDVTMNAAARARMSEAAGGRRTVPQIFVDGRHIGDSDGIAALEREGRLDALLAGAA